MLVDKVLYTTRAVKAHYTLAELQTRQFLSIFVRERLLLVVTSGGIVVRGCEFKQWHLAVYIQIVFLFLSYPMECQPYFHVETWICNN